MVYNIFMANTTVTPGIPGSSSRFCISSTCDLTGFNNYLTPLSSLPGSTEGLEIDRVCASGIQHFEGGFPLG